MGTTLTEVIQTAMECNANPLTTARGSVPLLAFLLSKWRHTRESEWSVMVREAGAELGLSEAAISRLIGEHIAG